MKYDQEKKWVRNVLKTADIANTLNGGISEPWVRLEKKEDHYLLKTRVPGVDIEKLKVDIVEKNVLVYHNLLFEAINESNVMMIPHVVASCPISPEIDYKNISAAVEGNILEVVLPFSELKSGYHKTIHIRR